MAFFARFLSKKQGKRGWFCEGNLQLSAGRRFIEGVDGRIYPSVPVEVLEDGVWKKGHADYRQRRPDGWHYYVTIYDAGGLTRLVWARYPDAIRRRDAATEHE